MGVTACTTSRSVSFASCNICVTPFLHSLLSSGEDESLTAPVKVIRIRLDNNCSDKRKVIAPELSR